MSGIGLPIEILFSYKLPPICSKKTSGMHSRNMRSAFWASALSGKPGQSAMDAVGIILK